MSNKRKRRGTSAHQAIAFQEAIERHLADVGCTCTNPEVVGAFDALDIPRIHTVHHLAGCPAAEATGTS